MSKNTGKEYEKLTQYIFKQILEQGDVKNIDVQHDVILQGKSTKHQIDVYWKFEAGGQTYSTIIQAKDWKNKVPQKEMLAFNDIIKDLPYGTTGIFVSANGYQKGAIEVAHANGITIYELRPPKDEDWDGRIKKFIITLNIKFPICRDIKVNLNYNFIKEMGIDGNFNNFKITVNDFGYLYDKNKSPYLSMEDLINKLMNENGEYVKFIKYDFQQETFIKYNEKYIKVDSIQGNFGFSYINEEMEIDGTNFVSYILKNVISKETTTFDDQLKIHKNTK